MASYRELFGINDYNDRAECTQQGVGGLPDVNTENPLFQKYYISQMHQQRLHAFPFSCPGYQHWPCHNIDIVPQD